MPPSPSVAMPMPQTPRLVRPVTLTPISRSHGRPSSFLTEVASSQPPFLCTSTNYALKSSLSTSPSSRPSFTVSMSTQVSLEDYEQVGSSLTSTCDNSYNNKDDEDELNGSILTLADNSSFRLSEFLDEEEEMKEVADSDVPYLQSSISSAEENISNVDSNILHITCFYFSQDESAIKTALRALPEGGATAAKTKLTIPQSPYSLPLHIALANRANLSVIKLLVVRSPLVLQMNDGPEELSPLALALTMGLDATFCHFLLAADTQKTASSCCTVTRNLPLHLACRHGVSLDLTLALLYSNPAAVIHKNLHGETPLNILMSRPQQREDAEHAQVFLERAARCFEIN